MNKIDLKTKDISTHGVDIDKKNIPIPKVTMLVNKLLGRNNINSGEILPQATIFSRIANLLKNK